ncbi:hypothetical protein NUSPORA_01479 [Nucleospora cyclopteri]
MTINRFFYSNYDNYIKFPKEINKSKEFKGFIEVEHFYALIKYKKIRDDVFKALRIFCKKQLTVIIENCVQPSSMFDQLRDRMDAVQMYSILNEEPPVVEREFYLEVDLLIGWGHQIIDSCELSTEEKKELREKVTAKKMAFMSIIKRILNQPN